MAYGLVPPERVLVPCLNAKTCGHNHPEPELEDDGSGDSTLLELAEEAIQTLGELLADAKVRYLKKYRIELPDYEESLAILRQSLRETREYQMRLELQDAEQLEDFC